jgi:hypothetical protein
MTAASSTRTAAPDTREMVLVHNVFRRLFGDLPWLVADVADGDLARAAVLADVFDEVGAALQHHHGIEDELLWPTLLPRVAADGALVLRAEEQHERVHELLERGRVQVRAFRATATAAAREAFVATLGELFTVLDEHLAEEETHILPLVEAHLSVAEWKRLGERARASLPKDRLLIQLGWILDAVPRAERRAVLADLPVPARVMWKLVGQRRWQQERRRIYEH